MPRPPKNPLNFKGKEMTYFERLILSCSKYLEEDGIYLNFEGYKETISEYSSLKENEIDKAWRLTKELNAWSEYFSEIANLIQKQYLDSETEKIEIQSSKSIEHSDKVATGDRFANTQAEVIYSRKKRNALKSLYEELLSKIKFLERGYYHCKSTCEWHNKIATSYNPQILRDDNNER